MLLSSVALPLDTTVSRKEELCDAAHLLELFQDEEGKLNDELELDLLSENGILSSDWHVGGDVIHHIQSEDVHNIDLLEYDLEELCGEHDAGALFLDAVPIVNNHKKRSCTFYNYPPTLSPSPTKRRRISASSCSSEEEEYIPSVQDLKLPTTTPTATDQKQDEVSKYLQERLDSLVQKFQSSYASIMESKQQLQHHQQQTTLEKQV